MPTIRTPRARGANLRPTLSPIAIAAVLALSAAPLSVSALTTYTWRGIAGNAWSTSGNWSGNQAPPVDGLATADLVFDVASNLRPDLNGTDYSVHSLVFARDAGAYKFGGGTLTLGAGGLTQNSSRDMRFTSTAVSLGADQTWTLTGLGKLRFDSGIDTGGGQGREGNILTIRVAGDGNDHVVNGAIRGAGALNKTGAGTLVLQQASTYTGGTAVVDGTLAIGTGASIAGGDLFVGGKLAISGGGSVTVNTDSFVVGRRTGGAASVELSDAGSHLSTYTAAIGSDRGGVGIFNQSNGSFTTNERALVIGTGGGTGDYTMSGGSLFTGLTAVGDGGTGVFDQFGGKHDTSKLSLSGLSESSNGTYNLNGGSLFTRIVTSGDGGISGTSTFNFNGGTLEAAFDADPRFLEGLTRAAVAQGGAIIAVLDKVTIAQNLLHDTSPGSAAVDGGLTKLAFGTLTLTGRNTYNGDTTFAQGVLAVGSAGALGTTGALVFKGGTLQYTKANQTDYSARFSTADGQQFSIDTNGQNVTLATGLTSSGGSLIKDGVGTLTLTGTNRYTGSTTVEAGTLALSGHGSVESSDLTVAGFSPRRADAPTLDITGMGTLVVDSLSVGVSGTGTVNQSGGRVTATESFSLGATPGFGIYNLSGTSSSLSTQDAYIGRSGSGTFNQRGGTFTTNGQALYLGLNGSGMYHLDGGTLAVGRLAGGGTSTFDTSTFDFNGGTLQASASTPSFMEGLTTANVQVGGAVIDTAGHDITIAQALVHDTTDTRAPTFDGGLTKLGAGTLTLSGTNTFTGGLNIVDGTLAVSAESNLGSSKAIGVGGSGTLLFTSSAALSRSYDLGVATLAIGGGETLTIGSKSPIQDGFLAGPGTFVLANGATLDSVTALKGSTLAQRSGTAGLIGSTVSGTLTQNGGALTFTDSLVTGSGRVSIGGTVNTTGAEFQGATTIVSGGTLANQGASLALTGGSVTTVNSGGTISTADGTTIELNGSQLINNGTQRGVLNVNAGSIAQGNGRFGAVDIGSGGTFSPGNGIGTAAADAVTFAAGGRYGFELNTAHPGFGIGSDLLNVAGLLAITAGRMPGDVFTIGIDSLNRGNQAAPLTDFDGHLAYHWLLVDAGSVSGFESAKFTIDSSGFSNSLDGGNFSVSLIGSDVYLDFTPMGTSVSAVPEPSGWALMIGGLGIVGLATRRRAGSVTVG